MVFCNNKFYMTNIPSTTQPIIPEAKSDSLSIELFLPFQFPLLSNVPRIVMLIIILSNFCAILFGLYCMFVKAINKIIHTIDIFNLMLYHVIPYFPSGTQNILQVMFWISFRMVSNRSLQYPTSSVPLNCRNGSCFVLKLKYLDFLLIKILYFMNGIYQNCDNIQMVDFPDVHLNRCMGN